MEIFFFFNVIEIFYLKNKKTFFEVVKSLCYKNDLDI